MEFFAVDATLTSTDRCVEIERQRRHQLRDVGRSSRDRAAAAQPWNRCCAVAPQPQFRVDAAAALYRRQTSEPIAEQTASKMTSAVVIPDVGQSLVLTEPRRARGGTGKNAINYDAPDDAVQSRKSKNTNKLTRRVRVRRHDSIITDTATSSDTAKVVSNVVAEVRSVPETNTNVSTKCGRNDPTISRPSPLRMRRWSSLEDFPGPGGTALQQRPREDGRGSCGRRFVSGRRPSRLDRHVYQCYFAGILHSSRRSERFVRLQKMYAMLENIVEIESEMLSHRQRTESSATNDRGCRSLIDFSNDEYWNQRSQQLRKLYAKLDSAQEDREFFYDNGQQDTFRWKSWRDLGLNRKNTSMTKLRDMFESVATDSRSSGAVSTSRQLQRFEHGLSYEKLLRMFQRLETSSTKEAEAWLRWESSSQPSVSSDRRLDGTYIKMMESAARNAKTFALHGYHMNEHSNRYDAYVQSRRIYRPKSTPSVYDENGDDRPEKDEMLSSDLTSIGSVSDSGRYCNEPGAGLVTKPASDLSDSSHVPSTTSCGSASVSATMSATQRQEAEARYLPAEKQSYQQSVCGNAAGIDSKGSQTREDNFAERQIAMIDDKTNPSGADALGISPKPKPRKRERQRPRSIRRNGTAMQRLDTISSDSESSAARRHIESWRRSSRPLSGTLNQALVYFNSRCVDDDDDGNDERSSRRESNGIAAPKSLHNDSGETFGPKDSAESFRHLTPTAENEELPASAKSVDERRKKFWTEIKLDVNSGEPTAAVPERRKVLPQLRSCRDAADLSVSKVPILLLPISSRAANIDKRPSPYVLNVTEPNAQRRGCPKADASKTETETVSSPVTAEVRPTYVKSAPVVRMRSESTEPTSGPSPMFVDCREAVVRRLPKVADRSCQPSSDRYVALNLVANTDSLATRYVDYVYAERSSLGDERKPNAKRSDSLKYETSTSATDAAVATQSSLPEEFSTHVKLNATNTTEINPSNLVRRTCQSLSSCHCEFETSDIRREAENEVNVNEDGENSGRSKFTSTASRSAGDLQRGCGRSAAPRASDSPCRIPRPIARPVTGRQDVEMRRIMDSLATIDSEWTTGKPTRSTQPGHSASDTNNNSGGRHCNKDDVNNEPPISRPSQREITALLSLLCILYSCRCSAFMCLYSATSCTHGAKYKHTNALILRRFFRKNWMSWY